VSPFRSRPQDPLALLAASDDVRDAVGQMVRQFADPMAFLRELVQNGIDAGATALTVTLDWEGGDGDDAQGTLRAAVTDDGAGMTQDVIERSLLVLFRSTKDRDATKIGKFGVGFFSVFAPEPLMVRVETGTDAAREGLRLTLRPDFTYELETSTPRRGTAVRLDLARSRGAARAFAAAADDALARWCPHVEVPLSFEVRGLGDADRSARVDRPLAGDGDASLTHRAAGVTYALRVSPRAASAAFYNRGLLLHACDEALVPHVALRVNAPDLHHTLSRDDVRRDAAFARVVDRARALAADALADALARSLVALAHACAERRHAGAVHDRAAAYVALVGVAAEAPFELRPEALPWPLVAPVAVRGSPRPWTTFEPKRWFRAAPVLSAVDRTPLALALAARGLAVVDLGVAGDARAGALGAALTARFGAAAVDVASRYGLPRVLHPSTLPEHAVQLAAQTGALLRVGDLGGAALGDLAGAGSDRAWIALRERDRAAVYDPALVIDADEEAPFALARGRLVVLNRAHPAVRAAVDLAARDAGLAAAMLARLVLLSGGRLDEACDVALVTRAVLGAEAPP
jgi:molecular chaperone HtpG